MAQEKCPKCDGDGKCRACNGKGYVSTGVLLRGTTQARRRNAVFVAGVATASAAAVRVMWKGDSRRRRKCVNRQVLFLSPHFVVRGVRKGGQRRLNEINKFQRQVRNVRVRDGGVQNG
jgi:hypothetical protein